MKETVEAAFLFRPHVVVTVDAKGFSFRLLKQLRGNMNHSLAISINPSHCLCNKSVVGKWFLQLDTVGKDGIILYTSIMWHHRFGHGKGEKQDWEA